MKLNFSDCQSFALAELATYNLSLSLEERNSSTKFLEKEIYDTYLELNSDEVKQARCNRFQVGRPADYSEKLITLENSGKVICGIRHMGTNPKHPFVHIIPNFQIRSKSHALEVYSELSVHFAMFSPLEIHFSREKEIDADSYNSLHMVAKIKTVLSKPSMPGEEKVILRQLHDESYFDWYTDCYQQLHSQNPHFQWTVTVNSKKTMQESLAQGLLYEAIVNNQRVGIIAATRSKLIGHEALYFIEILIDHKFRNMGLAKIVQRKFIQQVSRSEQYVWGTIDYKNLPSLKTAEANGRRSVRFECIVKL